MEAAVLVPTLIVFVSGAVLVVARGVPRAPVVAWMGVIGSAWACTSLWEHRLSAWGWVESDRMSQFLSLMILLGIALSLPVIKKALERDGSLRARGSRLYGLVLIAAAGMLLAVSTRNLLVVFVALEIVSYALFAFSGQKVLRRSTHLTSALTLIGLVLFRVDSGHFDLANIETVLLDRGSGAGVVSVLALGLFVGGVFLKLVPPLLHVRPVAVPVVLTAQIALFGPLLRMRGWFLVLGDPLKLILALAALVSMCAGNVRALRSKDWEGVLSASFLVHAGFLTLGLIAGGEEGRAAVLLYLLAFIVMGIGAWTAAVSLGSSEGGDWKGRGWHHPWGGIAMGIFLLSLAGVPLTMGFVGRLHLVSVSVRDVHLGLVAPALLNLLVCFYYTTRMVLDLFADPALKEDEGVEVGKGIAVSLLVCTFVIVAVGVWPEPCLALVKQVAQEFF